MDLNFLKVQGCLDLGFWLAYYGAGTAGELGNQTRLEIIAGNWEL